EAVTRLDHAPGDLGPWKCEPAEVDREALSQAGAEGYWIRRYANSRTGQSALVILLCGRSGRMSVHRPEHCYRGSGYEMTGAAVHFTLKPAPDGEAVTFWSGCFRKEEATLTRDLRIYWTWFTGDDWLAPDNPRLTFARHPALYKLYVVHDIDGVPVPPDKDP